MRPLAHHAAAKQSVATKPPAIVLMVPRRRGCGARRISPPAYARCSRAWSAPATNLAAAIPRVNSAQMTCFATLIGPATRRCGLPAMVSSAAPWVFFGKTRSPTNLDPSSRPCPDGQAPAGPASGFSIPPRQRAGLCDSSPSGFPGGGKRIRSRRPVGPVVTIFPPGLLRPGALDVQRKKSRGP